MRVGQDAEIAVRFRKPFNGAALAWGGLDFEGDGQPGWYIGSGVETGLQVAVPGLDRIHVMTVTPTAKSLPPSGHQSEPYNLVGKVMTVEGCMGTTGVRRNVTVTP